MSVVEERLDAILHDLANLPAEQVAQIIRRLLQQKAQPDSCHGRASRSRR